MASNAALKMVATLMLALFAGQLLVAKPAAAAEDGRHLQQIAPCFDFPVCGPLCETPCFKLCFTRCILFLKYDKLLCQTECTTVPVWCAGY